MNVRDVGPHDRDWVSELLLERWASTSIVSRGSSHDAAALPGFVAEVDGERAGLLIYEETERQVEVVTLDALRESIGVGTALLGAVVGLAGQHRCKRVWLVTTNDNLHALRFYQRRGFRLVAVHAGAVDKARALKPAIPTNGLNGIAIHDEIELACPMDQVFDNDRRQPA